MRTSSDIQRVPALQTQQKQSKEKEKEELNWNRRKALPDWEKRRIRNRHEKYLRKEKRSACVMALLVLAIIVVGIVGQIILVGGV